MAWQGVSDPDWDRDEGGPGGKASGSLRSARGRDRDPPGADRHAREGAAAGVRNGAGGARQRDQRLPRKARYQTAGVEPVTRFTDLLIFA